ncbi:MAG: hypothetical protein HOV94_34825 [Saccharothrix sp.]|nr:hypothetical protein [Saccharothrix sp.]
MTSLEELWSAVQSAATLRQAHDALLEVVPSREATRVEWRDFHLRAAEVYRRVAETDRGRQGEALFFAEQQREKAEKIAQVLAADAGARRKRRRTEPHGPEDRTERDNGRSDTTTAKAYRCCGRS